MKLQPMINSFSLSSSESENSGSDSDEEPGVVHLSDAEPVFLDEQKSDSQSDSQNVNKVALASNEETADTKESAKKAKSGHSIISRRAMVTIRYAEDLAKRGAVYSAEAEFIQALKLIAHAYDAQSEETIHIPALLSGLTALKEADDFAQQGLPVALETNLSRFVTTHKTPVLKEAELEEITPLEALQKYYSFAEHELAFAGGTDPAASQAFYGLARLQNMYPKETKKRHGTGPAKAIALHRTALRINNKNYKAANELGVLLAKAGHFENAKECLVQSLKVSPQPESWKNLARVCEELGNQNQAKTAWATYQKSLKQAKEDGNSNQISIRWVDFKDFNDPKDASWQNFPSKKNVTTANSSEELNQTDSKQVDQTSATQVVQPPPTKRPSGIESLINFARNKAGQINRRNQTKQ